MIGDVVSGFADVEGAKIYYEVGGEGPAFIMIHAGVAASRQWNSEFARFSNSYRVVRYDLRGFGKSEPIEAEFSRMRDFDTLLRQLGIEEPTILMGCSMGGGLAMDFALARPSMVKALIMVASGPSGLKLDVPPHPSAEAAEAAYNEGDLTWWPSWRPRSGMTAWGGRLNRLTPTCEHWHMR